MSNIKYYEDEVHWDILKKKSLRRQNNESQIYKIWDVDEEIKIKVWSTSSVE